MAPRRIIFMVKQRISVSSFLKVAILLLFVVALAWSLYHRPGSGIHADNAEKIKQGMTVQEATAILGDPPGDYTTLPTDMLDYSDFKQLGPEYLVWVNDQYCFRVVIHADGKVLSIHCAQSWASFVRMMENVRPSYWKRFRSWLGI